jgi:Ni/Fe-hydrogenase subunit HybB-like protein
MNKNIEFAKITSHVREFRTMLFIIFILLVIEFGAAFVASGFGQYVTGRDNQIVWGFPHVAAILLILSGAGVLNIASLASAFGRAFYKPLARLSATMAIALLSGGLIILAFDLGRLEILYAFFSKDGVASALTWNFYFFIGFFVVSGLTFLTLTNAKAQRATKPVGVLALVISIAMASSTGAVFIALFARPAYDNAIIAPLFVVMALSFGLAACAMVLALSCAWTLRPLGEAIVKRLSGLLGIFVALGLYFTAIFHFPAFFGAGHTGLEHVSEFNDTPLSWLFWVGQIFLGGFVPLLLLFDPQTRKSPKSLFWSSALVILGGGCQLYVIIIGGQVQPLVLFPGMEVSSSFFDGHVTTNYSPGIVEIMLSASGLAVSFLILSVAMRTLPLLPKSLADAVVDPHHGLSEKVGKKPIKAGAPVKKKMPPQTKPPSRKAKKTQRRGPSKGRPK